ncbi:uncharacterized protein LOC106076581 [Biomphalaria glabrata]|uniref:Uncharacterized protein LOC106076581 n=1 Tax=Biomphalaria glabrata TaxID=6526 RepID=A0A9W2YQW8_BIOGL|nr:uncharacterized protein LOC106076581 [Biomphalaria glabrata]
MECNISGCPYFNAFKKFYTYDCVDKNTIEFSCLNNFHYVSGNVTSSCINNTWTSEEAIVCEVDYLMQSSILAPLIAGSTIFLCFIFLFIDLYLYRLDSIRIHNSVVRRHWHCGPLRVLENYTMRPLQYQGKV